MTVFRSKRRAALALLAALTVIIPASADAAPHRAAGAQVAAPSTTAPQVASEAPTPGVGPLGAPEGSEAGEGLWWLLGFGGLQVVGLLVITRRARARARLAAPDVAS